MLALVLAEGSARALGHAPWTPPRATFEVAPSPWVEADPELGWALRPGAFTFTFPGGLSATATHDADGRRVTPPGSGRVLELHGGSFAYGLGLDDDDTLGARLQARLPDHDVQVRAVPGHGPVQAWAALEGHIAAGDGPYAMVVTYVAFHDERVTWNRSWRRALSGSPFSEAAGMPAVRTVWGPPDVESVDPSLDVLPGARAAALVASLDRLRDGADERRLRSSSVARNLLVQLHHRAKEHGTYVLVVGLSSDAATRATLKHLRDYGVLTLDAGLDWTDPAHQLWPHDAHPSAASADHWARAIAELVQRGADPRPPPPSPPHGRR